MRVVLFLLALVASPLAAAPVPQHVIVCGGPALLKWEKLRVKDERHDRWWANFIRASTIRIDELRRAYGPNARVTWIVYRPGYVTRGREDGKTLIRWIEENAAKRQVKLVWVSSGDAAIRAINAHPSRSVLSFDYFGHSNRHCFMLDYGNTVMAVSKAWIHEHDLRKIRRGIFNKSALCQSYGCHTGESMSSYWKKALGIPLVGAKGKTDYAVVGQGRLPTVSGRWVR